MGYYSSLTKMEVLYLKGIVDNIFEMNIMYQFDANYAPYAGISIESLLSNNKNVGTINIFLVTVGDMGEDLQKIKDTVEKFNRNVVIIDAKSIEKNSLN